MKSLEVLRPEFGAAMGPPLNSGGNGRVLELDGDALGAAMGPPLNSGGNMSMMVPFGGGGAVLQWGRR